jgi:tetratricopeptide (TPR) repeat protein
VLRAVGRFDEAIVNTRKATELDPLNTQAWTALGSLLLASGDRNGAYQALNRSLEINPQQAFAAGWLGIGLVMEGRAAEALATFERSTAPHFRLMGAAIAHHSLGHAAESQKALDELVAKYGHSAAYQIAVVYAWRGETDRAFEWLDRAYAQHDGGLTLLKVDPLMRGLHDDPRYEALLRKLNLPID